MTNKVEIKPADSAYRLLNPGSPVLVSVGDAQRDNLFTVTWNMPVRKDPGMVGILSGKRHFSYPLIIQTGEFGLNVPHLAILEATLGCGRVSGAEVADKFARFGLTRQRAIRIQAPLVQEAVGNLECRVAQVVDLGRSALLIAQILTGWADPKHFDKGAWRFDNGLKLIHHLGSDDFCVSERMLTGSIPTG